MCRRELHRTDLAGDYTPDQTGPGLRSFPGLQTVPIVPLVPLAPAASIPFTRRSVSPFMSCAATPC